MDSRRIIPNPNACVAGLHLQVPGNDQGPFDHLGRGGPGPVGAGAVRHRAGLVPLHKAPARLRRLRIASSPREQQQRPFVVQVHAPRRGGRLIVDAERGRRNEGIVERRSVFNRSPFRISFAPDSSSAPQRPVVPESLPFLGRGRTKFSTGKKRAEKEGRGEIVRAFGGRPPPAIVLATTEVFKEPPPSSLRKARGQKEKQTSCSVSPKCQRTMGNEHEPWSRLPFDSLVGRGEAEG